MTRPRRASENASCCQPPATSIRPHRRRSTERRPFRDNPRLVLLGIALLIAALVAMVTLADRSTELNPDFLSEVVLYAVSAADLTMLVVLAFVLARNIVKLMVERRRGLPFSRFRAKLVLAMLGLTIVPSVLVLIVGGELIRSSTERWLRVPIDDVLRLSTQIAGDYYREREARVEANVARIAAALPASAIAEGDAEAVRRAIAARGDARGASRWSRSIGPSARRAATRRCVPIATVSVAGAAATAPSRGAADTLAARVLAGSSDPQTFEPLAGGSELVRAGAVVRDRQTVRRSAWWSPAITCPASSPRMPGASPRPTRNTTRSR